jgi:NodT family efflux transporter outer membrane factor (OMF) lipoprotein
MNDSARRRMALGALLLGLVPGCAVGPDFVPPPAPTSTRYTPADQAAFAFDNGAEQQQVSTSAAMPLRWWEAFQSPALNRLHDHGLSASPTLDAARATLAQANDVLVAARGPTYPQVTAAASASRGSGIAARAGSAGQNQFSIGPALSYTPDLAGGIARRIEQAEAQVDYQRTQWAAAYLALTGNTVLQAIALASANEQIGAAQDIVAVDQRNLELVQLSTAAGKSSQLDALTAESQLASDRALLPPLRQQASVARYALAVLAGQSSGDWSPPALDLNMLALPRALPLSLPSGLVHRRPDIVAAEAQLHAANAAIGIASAQLYPAVTLSASWTLTAGSSGALLSGGSDVWSFAAALLAPLFDGYTLAAQRAAAIQAYAALLANYRQTVLQAYAQVAGVLEGLQNDAALLDAQRRAYAVAQTTLDLTQQSYQAGQASLLQLLETQRLYQQARLGLARAIGQRYADTAQFFIVMGGAALWAEDEQHNAR